MCVCVCVQFMGWLHASHKKCNKFWISFDKLYETMDYACDFLMSLCPLSSGSRWKMEKSVLAHNSQHQDVKGDPVEMRSKSELLFSLLVFRRKITEKWTVQKTVEFCVDNVSRGKLSTTEKPIAFTTPATPLLNGCRISVHCASSFLLNCSISIFYSRTTFRDFLFFGRMAEFHKSL